MKEKSTWSFQVVIHLQYSVWSWSPWEKTKQMSGLFLQDASLNYSPSKGSYAQNPGRAMANSFDPSVVLGDTMVWFLLLLASQVVINELGEMMVFLYSCGVLLSPAFFHRGDLDLEPSLEGGREDQGTASLIGSF